MKNTVISLTIVRMSVGLFFMLYWAFKLFIAWPAAIVAMMANLFWVEPTLASYLAWFLILLELIWGFLIILWNIVSRTLYNTILVAFIWIIVVGFTVTYYGSGAPMADVLTQWFWHLQLLLVTIALIYAPIKCAFWITGDNN